MQNNKQFVLVIKREDDTVLNTIRSSMEIFSTPSNEIQRNIYNKIIDGTANFIYKCTIKTMDQPIINLLEVGKLYKIYSTILFKQYKLSGDNIVKTTRPAVENSIENHGDFITYRPIFEMHLTQYRVDESNKFSWILEFEEA